MADLPDDHPPRSTMTDSELAALAARTGLTALHALDPAAFAKAVETARTMGDGTARPTNFAAEPAHTARFPLIGGTS